MILTNQNSYKAALFLMATLTLLCTPAVGFGAPLSDQVARELEGRFKASSSRFTAIKGPELTYPFDAVLEVGSGSGHGGNLEWIRFQPEKDFVSVLSIELDERWHQYRSKWPPDNAPVVVRQAKLDLAAYRKLLKSVAEVSSAKLTAVVAPPPVMKRGELPPFSISASMTTNSFWVYARVESHNHELLKYNWTGYAGSREEIVYIKPKAVENLATNALVNLKFEPHQLTAKERAEVSAKFVRDWNLIDDSWWVKERYVILAGVAGDTSALPLLKDAMSKEGKSANRLTYYAINAITRITKKDVRDRPVEEMDIEQTRDRVLSTLNEVSEGK